MSHLFQNKELTVETSELPDSPMKTFYEGEGVVRVKLFFIADNKEELWFLSVGTSNPEERFRNAFAQVGAAAGCEPYSYHR
jgi:hypothetical protein